MWLLIAGLILWSAAHFLPAKAISLRQKLVNGLGEKAYRGVFSIVVLASLALIVFGWRSITPDHLYLLPSVVKPVALVLMAIAILLFTASNLPTRIKYAIRHPQLMSVILWSIAHLLLNGDTRSLLLFGGLGIWAFLQMLAINQRDGDWAKAETPAVSKEVLLLVISVVVFCVVIFAHPYLSGMPAI
jgi:uncharacterized membrane protein